MKDYVLDVQEAIIQDRTNVGLYQRYHPPHTNQEWVFKNGAGETVSLL